MTASPPDGDVVVPRCLAGPRVSGDEAIAPLTALGWPLRHDELGNVHVEAPDLRFRLGFVPEGEDDALWRITAYIDPYGTPAWAASFSEGMPTEIVTAFTSMLAQSIRAPESVAVGAGRFTALQPLLDRGWTHQAPADGMVHLAAPDKQAQLTFAKGPLQFADELLGRRPRWHLWGGPKTGPGQWYAEATTGTPTPLLTALTTSLSDPEPLLRWRAELLPGLRQYARPLRPRPTPLALAHAAARPRPAPRRSVVRWTTSSRGR
ncbi:DUF317 domain-containing protein [Streptomyces sp. MS19]|uniref:DUF317 domain-containing protein n=1 Tax=Streptomyces sp. MS19 TaxID=3385972 RepID=UPI0039A17D04